MPEPFDPGAFGRALGRVPWVSRVIALEETGSTNEDALTLAGAGTPHGTVVVADSQTAGRGRLGRSWWSEPGTTLIASWVMRPSEVPERWSRLTLACGVAAAEALRSTTGIRAELKWPNDVLAGGRKLAGILAEARPPDAMIAGIGVNLDCRIPAELAETATTVQEAGGHVPPRADLLAALLNELGRFLDGVDFMERYRVVCSTLGCQVRIERVGAPVLIGIAREVRDDGSLIVDTAGKLVRVASGDVVHVR